MDIEMASTFPFLIHVQGKKTKNTIAVITIQLVDDKVVFFPRRVLWIDHYFSRLSLTRFLNSTKSNIKMPMILILKKWGSNSKERWSLEHLQFQASGRVNFAVYLQRIRETLDVFILARHSILAVLKETDSSCNRSGVMARQPHLEVGCPSWQPSQATGLTASVTVQMCINEKVV